MRHSIPFAPYYTDTDTDMPTAMKPNSLSPFHTLPDTNRSASAAVRPSKWEDAQRWVIITNSYSNSNYFDSLPASSSSSRGLIMQSPTRIASMRDAATEISPSTSRRDMGTQITTNSTSTHSHSRSASFSSIPTERKKKKSSPPRHNSPSPPTQPLYAASTSSTINPLNELEYDSIRLDEYRCRPLGKEWVHLFEKNKLSTYYYYNSSSDSNYSNRSSGGVQEDQRWKSFLPMDCSSTQVEISNQDEDDEEKEDGEEELRWSTLAWEEAERAKLAAQYKQEEAKIEAWSNLEKAKAEAELKKLEVKLENLRTQAMKKTAYKLQIAQKRAKEMRALAATRQVEQIAKIQERVAQIRKNGNFLSTNLTICFARLSSSSTG